MNLLLCLTWIVAYFWTLMDGQDVFSCGGFVKSPVPIDFSKVMVKLYTREMNLKYETDCAPNNGYYMIPVYSRGQYVLKVHPPPGYSFEPEQVELTVDGVNDQCTKGVDINFSFLGFSVTGQVLSKGSKSGPSDFSIGLTKAGVEKPLFVTKTGADGRYEFKGVLPGEYRLINIDTSMCVEKQRPVITVAPGASNVAQPLRIEGYSITGTVKNQGQPVAGAQVLIFAETKTELSGCDPSPVKELNLPSAAANLHYACRQTSSATGDYKFSCVPSGNYVLVPYFKSDGVTFDMAPKFEKVAVSHGAIVVKEPFQVVGFTVPGRVLWKEKGQGVNGAEVWVDDKFSTQTNQNGDYLLERMSAGKFKITAKRDGVEFTTVQVELSSKNHRIPEVIAASFQICGKVTFNSFPTSVPKLTQRKLLMTNLETKGVFSLTTDQDGSFCRMSEPGTYVLEPQILPNEKQAGLVLIPKERKINVVDKPIKDINFSQFEAKISGSINCIGVCKQLKIQLTTANNDEEVSSIHFERVDSKETFHFTHLLPGAYIVKLVSDNYCWEKSELKVNVEQADVTDLNFRQTGHRLSILSTNPAELSYALDGGKNDVKGTTQLKSGSNTFCLPKGGAYALSLKSCHRFEPHPLKYDTGNPGVLSVTAIKHSVTGAIATDARIEDILVHVSSNKQSQPRVLGPLTNVRNTSDGRFAYDLEIWAESGEELILEPKSSLYLFSPERQTIHVETDCLLNAIKFVGVKGLFLKARIEPGLSSVKILLREKKSGEIVLDGVTDKNGECSLGPLKSFDGYEVNAELQGYTFEAISGGMGRFKAFKLSELVIQAVDTGKKPLTGVLISLSGTDYRSNNLTDESGSITFFGLTPGEYFLRPVLKEFSFQPATHVVKIAEGSAERIQVLGKRVAYSCSGLLRYLAGQPVAGAMVEAVSPGCNNLQEETVTSADGTFRIRGLQPGCRYVLRMKESPDTPATFPRQLPIEVKEADIDGVVLVLRPLLTTTDVTGRVDCEREFLPSLRVVLFKGDAGNPVHSIHLQASIFFLPSIDLDNSTYTARLESTLNQNEYENLNTPEIIFKADGTSKFLNFLFKPKKKSPEAEISKSSYVALPLTILLVVMAYHYEKVLPLAREYLGDFITFIQHHQIARSSAAPGVSSTAEGLLDTGDVAGGSGIGETGTKKKMRIRKT